MKNNHGCSSNEFKTAENENFDWIADFLNYWIFFLLLFPNIGHVYL